MKTYLALAFILYFQFSLLSQKSLQGLILDNETQKPVEFANIGIPNKGIGTVSNEKGIYSLVIPDSFITSVVRISMIGYITKNISVEELMKLKTISLMPSNTTLNEVTVSAKKTKIKIVGNDTRTKTVSAGFVSNNLGTELAVKLKIKHPSTQLRKFFVNINSKDSVNPIFRFNVYKVAKRGEPGDNLLNQNIIINVKQMPSFIEIDLCPYAIYVDEDIFISIEWIKEISKGNSVMFSAKLIGNPTYFKNASQDKWQKLPSIGVGLHAEIGY
jgi:hypothetical protein